MAYLAGIDVGTSGARTLIIDESGALVGSGTIEYPMSTPHPLWAEQDPEDWWQAVCGATQIALDQGGISADKITGIGLTGQMHGMVMLDKGGRVLRPCIMWNDQRTAAQYHGRRWS